MDSDPGGGSDQQNEKKLARLIQKAKEICICIVLSKVSKGCCLPHPGVATCGSRKPVRNN